MYIKIMIKNYDSNPLIFLGFLCVLGLLLTCCLKEPDFKNLQDYFDEDIKPEQNFKEAISESFINE